VQRRWLRFSPPVCWTGGGSRHRRGGGECRQPDTGPAEYWGGRLLGDQRWRRQHLRHCGGVESSLATVPDVVVVGSVMKGTDGDATQCLLKWQQIADTLPDELFIRVVIFKAKNSAPTKLAVVFNIFYAGPAGQTLPLLQERFPELGVAQEHLSEMGWAQSTVKVADFGDLSLEHLMSRYFKGKSDYVTRAIPQSGLEGIWGKMLREDIEEKYMILTPYGGTMLRIPKTAIPFLHRKGTMFKIQYMTPYVSSNPIAAYVNYRDVDIGANNFGGGTTYERAQIWGAKYFKGNFDRLVAVKTTFDPTNFFCNEQSVPPLAGAGGNSGGSRQRKKNGARSGGHCWFCNIFFICILLLRI
ncbi:Berberine bridge enzyme-like 13, partial [Linum grandiflorum]